ncbi:hypothetical protein [Serinibacter arcticus]|uniref:hypothetical protein n=1 Tax=Serinibacter arcticus TaxID=1655435 RepID=UPI0011B27991|nr:hypothetical protein [Serinibacter arcticus]
MRQNRVSARRRPTALRALGLLLTVGLLAACAGEPEVVQPTDPRPRSSRTSPSTRSPRPSP